MEYSKRVGKPAILNRLFAIFQGDVLVTVDADTVLNDNLVIERLVSKFYKDKSIGIITGNAQPLPAKTFLESCINNYIYARNKIFDAYSFKNTAYTVRGFIAYSKKFLKYYTLPEEIVGDDTFAYFYCLKNGYKIYHQKKAVIWYRSAQSITDHLRQSTRHLAISPQLYQYFDRQMVDRGFKVPPMALLKIMLYQLLKNPVGYILLKILNTYSYHKSRTIANTANVKWDSIVTSKDLAIN